MANILSLGTEDISDISALKEAVGEPRMGESSSTGLFYAVEELENEVTIAQNAVEDLEIIVNSVDATAAKAQDAATEANQLAAAALPKSGGTMTGAIISTDLILRSPNVSYDVLDFGDRSEGSYNSIRWSQSGALVPAASTIILRSIKSPVLDSDVATKGYADSIGFNATIPRSAQNKVFYNASFSGEGYNFTNCLFISCTMQYNNMVFSNCTFINCIINFGVVDAGQSNSLRDCFLIGCKITSALMTSARITACKLNSCIITNESISWSSCNFNSCYFSNTSKAPIGLKPSLNNYPESVNKTSGGGVSGS